jgi:CBS-domain-containing membrane protein
MIAEKDKNVKSLLSLGVSYILQPNIVILDQFQTAADAILEMKKHSSRAILIAGRKQEIIGLVSKTDILYKILSLHKSVSRVVLEEIMSTPIISIPPDMSVADALSVMENHDIRQVLVSENSKIYGILYREDIIMKLERAMIETNKATKLDSPLCIMDPFASAFISEKKSMLACPHCKAEYKDKDLLSKHVRVIHSPAKE